MGIFDKIAAKIPIHKQEESVQYFFCLDIGLSEVTGSVWSLLKNTVDILGESTLSYSGTEDLLEKGNIALDQAIGALDVEPNKILFGVPDSWLLDDNLKDPYLRLLRRIIKEYELEPMAYVATTHALAHYLQKKEGGPQTSVFLRAGEFIEAAMVKGGKIIESRYDSRSDHIFDDIVKLFKQFSEVEVFPSKILLYSDKKSEDLAKIRDELMDCPWMSKLPFLHFPKIEVLEKDISTKSLILAGAFEIDPEVSLNRSFLKKQSTSSSVDLEESSSDNLALHPHQLMRQTDESEDLGIDNTSNEETPRKELKINKMRKIPQKIKDDKDHSRDNISDIEGGSENMFAVEKEESTKDMNLPMPYENDYKYKENKIYKMNISNITSSFRQAIKAPLQPLLHHLKNNNKSPLIPLFVFILFILVIGISYLFLVKASVVVYVEPKIMENQAQVIADPTATSVDQNQKIIPGSIVETTVSGSDQGTATGSKQIGNPAKGKVTIRNKSDTPIILAANTELTNSSGLKFTLDSQISATSAATVSTANGYQVDFGSSDANVTASEIGPDGNLPAGTILTISGYDPSKIDARVEDAFSGGTSQTVTVVTADDQAKLKQELLDNLKQKASQSLQDSLQGSKKIIAEALSVVDGKYDFNKEVGDEASTFSLDATVHFKGTAYSETDLRTIVGKLVETKVPDGFEMSLADTQTTSDVASVGKDGKLVFNAKFRTKLLPKLDSNILKKAIEGKTVSQATNKLTSMNNILGANIHISPSFISKFALLPFFGRNISIVVTTK